METSVSTGSSDKSLAGGASIVAAIPTLPSELPLNSGWIAHVKKLVLLGHCPQESKPCIGQLAASVPLLALVPHLLST